MWKLESLKIAILSLLGSNGVAQFFTVSCFWCFVNFKEIIVGRVLRSKKM